MMFLGCASAVKLFEEELSDIVHYQRFDTKQQTYEKIPQWLAVIPKALSALPTAGLSAVASIEQLLSLRQAWMRGVGNALAKAIVSPFIARALLDTNLHLLFKACEQLHEATVTDFRARYEEAVDAVELFTSQCVANPSLYARSLFQPLADTARRVIDAAYQRSDLVQPARLLVRPSSKKYSLTKTANNIRVRLIVENTGKGPAQETSLEFMTDLPLEVNEQFLGHVPPGTMEVEIPCLISDEFPNPLINVLTTWHNSDGSTGEELQSVMLETESVSLDWDSMLDQAPYNLTAVGSDIAFVGRKEALDQLYRQANGSSVGSAYIFGQRRVGKTSLANALKARLERQEGFHVCSMAAGEFLHSRSEETINQLGDGLVAAIRTRCPACSEIKPPTFNGALSPLTTYLNELTVKCQSLRLLFVMDDFDLLPPSLYEPGPLSMPLFATLRAISHKPPFGFILIGGERMENVFRYQGEQLNHFKSMRLDYFDRETHWNDFVELVRHPTKGLLEFTDRAVSLLYDCTAGNPYFTKMICGDVFQLMVRRHDRFVTETEIMEAARATYRTASENSFQHFWRDGITARDEDAQRIELLRKRTLLALSRLLQEPRSATRDAICQQLEGEQAAAPMLDEFVRRQVFEIREAEYRCKVKLFEQWLVERGHRELALSLQEQDVLRALHAADAAAYVKSGEIVEVVQRWGTYQGQSIGEERVRGWLEQFDGRKNQRLMFQLLKSIKFYSSAVVREKVREAQAIVFRDLASVQANGPQRKKGGLERTGPSKRNDIVVSYLDQPAKSGAAYAKLFADENGIFADKVWTPTMVREYLENGALDLAIKAIVFVDDFIGTGRTVVENLEKLLPPLPERCSTKDLKLFVVVVCGCTEGLQECQRCVEQHGWPIVIHACDTLDDADRCFGAKSSVFESETDRLVARELAQREGAKLENRHPLGYGGGERLVVFSDTCPNNTLPILSKVKGKWSALFPRK